MNGFLFCLATPYSYTDLHCRTVAGVAVSAGEKFTSNGYTWMQLDFGREGPAYVNVVLTKFVKNKTHAFFLLSSP